MSRVGEAVGFALLLAVWVAAYAIVCPSEPARISHHLVVAELR